MKALVQIFHRSLDIIDRRYDESFIFFFFLDFVSLCTIQILLRIIICHVVRVVKSCLLKFIKKIIYKYKHL